MTVKMLLAAVAAAAIASSASKAAADPARSLVMGVCETEMARASAKFGVPLPVLYAVGLTETGGSGTLQPYIVAGGGKALIGTDPRDAVRLFNQMRRSGVTLIDLGCMQINQRYHGEEFSSLEDMFNPRRNVEYAARFLSELRVREGSWTMAAARYNAGPNNTPAQKRYVCAVLRNLVRSGFGAWTPKARNFCA